ncbi:hypothetical protein FMUND_3108 [Fusarium mundagurra]|uniref:F-box domain-containing protein n=1 Tax=Fusarium mundagurra TaxID=1567541 RepID=A0A8H6DLU7_9HYPO|nr:hypothetical protein FMUND_3108 [Fusarium mundagurra]
MESCHIIRLPDELLVAVVELLPGDALKATRATCRKLNSIASPYLYPVLYLSCHQLDLDVFRLVASNPLLIGGVKELVIDDTTLSPRLGNWKVYKTVASYPRYWSHRKTAYSSKEDFEYEGRVWSDKPDKDFHALYKSVLKGHHNNRRRNADIISLKRALPLFKSLRSLVISNRTADDDFDSGAQTEESSSPVVKMWRRLGVSKQERPPFPPRCDWMAPFHHPGQRGEVMRKEFLHDELDRAIKAYGLPPANGKASNSDDWNWLGDDIFRFAVGREARAIIIALEVLKDPAICSRLTEFRVDPSHELCSNVHEPGLPILLFDGHESPFPSRLASSLFNCKFLTKFHLVLSNYWDPLEEEHKGWRLIEQGDVALLFTHMPQLEDILLEPHGMPIFLAIPGNITFSRLRRFEFSCGEIFPNDLVSFVERHAPTLEYFSIQHCSIDPFIFEEGWVDVMRDIRRMQEEEKLILDNGQVVGVYEDVSYPDCWETRNSRRESADCPLYTWEFVECSLWGQVDGYPWDFEDGDWSYVGRGEDTESEDGESDKDGGDEGGGSEQEASGI